MRKRGALAGYSLQSASSAGASGRNPAHRG